MQQLTLIRAAVLIVMRDILVPGSGLYLVLVSPGLSHFQPWHLPLVAGLIGVPLVARGAAQIAGGEDTPQLPAPSEDAEA